MSKMAGCKWCMGAGEGSEEPLLGSILDQSGFGLVFGKVGSAHAAFFEGGNHPLF
jgi:hypothetical protein